MIDFDALHEDIAAAAAYQASRDGDTVLAALARDLRAAVDAEEPSIGIVTAIQAHVDAL